MIERELGRRGGEGRYRLRGRRYLGERWSDMPLNIVSENRVESFLVKGGRHTGIFENMSFAEKSSCLLHRLRSITVYRDSLALERIGP